MFGNKTLLSFLVVAVISGFMFIWFGVFNVSANDKHWAITNTFLELVRNRSISARAEPLNVPQLDDPARVKRGAANYQAMCAQCHLAPGIDTSELYEGLYPKPPVLYKDPSFASKPHETFWVVKNGIKMTGMPEWGIYNSDEQIWDIIALTSALDKMTAEQYRKLVTSGKHAHKDAGHSSMDENESSEDAGHSSMDENESSESVGHGHVSNKKIVLKNQNGHDKTPDKH